MKDEQVAMCHIGRAIDEYHSCLRWLYAALSAADPHTRANAITKALVAGPYCELFARHPREGWTQWGNQLPGAQCRGAINDQN